MRPTRIPRCGYAIDPQAPIRIVVNGHVELDGVVDTVMDKQIAGMQASSVPGVFSVQTISS